MTSSEREEDLSRLSATTLALLWLELSVTLKPWSVLYAALSGVPCGIALSVTSSGEEMEVSLWIVASSASSVALSYETLPAVRMRIGRGPGPGVMSPVAVVSGMSCRRSSEGTCWL